MISDIISSCRKKRKDIQIICLQSVIDGYGCPINEQLVHVDARVTGVDDDGHKQLTNDLNWLART